MIRGDMKPICEISASLQPTSLKAHVGGEITYLELVHDSIPHVELLQMFHMQP